MLNSTVELITLWASWSSPSLLAFCFSHLIIAALLLGGRGEWAKAAAEAETMGGIQVQGERRSSGGLEDESPTTAASTVESKQSCAANVNNGGDGCAAEVETSAVTAVPVQVQANEKNSGAEGGPAARDEEGDSYDDLMMRAEEFIQRMNRVWRTENGLLC